MPFHSVHSARIRDVASPERRRTHRRGARTLDTLIALVARPNEAISKRELMAVVWPDVTVEEGSLRVQIAAVRKAPANGAIPAWS